MMEYLKTIAAAVKDNRIAADVVVLLVSTGIGAVLVVFF